MPFENRTKARSAYKNLHKRVIADTFDLPKEIVLNMPKLDLVIGNVNVFLKTIKELLNMVRIASE